MDSIFGLDQACTDEGKTRLPTVPDHAEMAIVCGRPEDEGIPYLTKDRGSGGAVRVIAGYSMYGTDISVPEEKYDDAVAVLDAYRNGTPVEDDNGADEEPDAED